MAYQSLQSSCLIKKAKPERYETDLADETSFEALGLVSLSYRSLNKGPTPPPLPPSEKRLY